MLAAIAWTAGLIALFSKLHKNEIASKHADEVKKKIISKA